MKIGIIGNGVVGSTLTKYLKEIRIGAEKKQWDVLVYDPPQNKKDDINNADIVFISVPVPTNNNGGQDLTILQESLGMLTSQPVYVRSTVLPGTCDALSKEHSKNIYAMPEFLTERTAYQNFLDQQYLFVGDVLGKDGLLLQIFDGYKEIIKCTNVECEMMKYTHNCFGALKINYFNHIFKVCKDLGVKYDTLIENVAMINHMDTIYTKVPGPDGEFGFGGKCFPKDTQAFAERFGIDVLHQTLKDNALFRSKEIE